MSVCGTLRNGQDSSCEVIYKKYYQQAVLVNRSDIENKAVVTSYTDIDDNYHCRLRAYFSLFEDKAGFRFQIGESASYIQGIAEKIDDDGVPQYKHSVTIAVMGVTEESKCILSQLDYGDYFAALQFADGTIELYGFEYGLSTNNYSYAPGQTGGALITLQNLSDSPEDELPLVYFSGTPDGEIADFDRLFLDNAWDDNGDFNDDFNNDFNNED